MNRSRHFIFSLICLLQCLAAGQAVPVLKIIHTDGHTATLTADQISKLSHVTVSTRDHDTPVQFEGVPLSTVLATTGIQLGDTLHGARLTEVLTVTASDGYKVVFALAEVDPAFAMREIILADKRDGKQLGPKEGPFRIVAPGDKRAARWARQVVELKISSSQ